MPKLYEFCGDWNERDKEVVEHAMRSYEGATSDVWFICYDFPSVYYAQRKGFDTPDIYANTASKLAEEIHWFYSH